jgi:ABC-type maltose transport system permease subunit
MERRKVYRSEFVEGVWNTVLVIAFITLVFTVVFMLPGAC